MRLGLVLSIAALAACSSTGEPAQTGVTNANRATEPTEKTEDPYDPRPEPVGEDAGTPGVPPAKKDAGYPDAKAPADAGPIGPAAYTKAELQTIFDDRCAPCHIDIASGTMSLANDFTTNTVGVDSTELPSMKRIAKGDHANSYLFHKVNGTHTTVGGSGARMPKNGTPFTATELDRLAKFIDGL